MKLLARTILLTFALLAAAGCLQHVDDDLVSKKVAKDSPVNWELAGEFGGHAEILRDSADPYMVRYKPGGFLVISGLDATDDEVYIADWEISRIQVFDFEGNHLRSFGSGVPIEGTLISDDTLLEQETTFDRKNNKTWQFRPEAKPWLEQPGEYFRASDVEVNEEGIWLSSSVTTEMRAGAKRKAGPLLIKPDGTTEDTSGNLHWTSYIDVDGNRVVVTDSYGNNVQYSVRKAERWPIKESNTQYNVPNLIRAQTEEAKQHSQFQVRWMRATNAGATADTTYMVGGAAIAFNKLVVCDTGNNRIKVLDMNNDNVQRWGNVLRIIPGQTDDGIFRFASVKDIDISEEGYMFAIDPVRLEGVIMNDYFDRIGRFADGDLVEPYAISLSDNEKHLFITDRRSNKVLHYELRQ